MRFPCCCAIWLLLLAGTSLAKKTPVNTIQRETLSEYVQRMQQQGPDLSHSSPGSLWTDNGRLASMNTD